MNRMTHEHLLDLVIYDRLTGAFYARRGRPGCRPGQPLGHVEANGYRRIMIGGVRYLAHRLAWFYEKGVWPLSELDHRDLNRDHNAIDNLREATRSQNHANTLPSAANTSGFKGVCWNRFRGYWQAYIKAEGKSHSLGRFQTKEEAYTAYAAAAVKFHGEFARVL